MAEDFDKSPSLDIGQMVPDCVLFYVFSHLDSAADLCRASSVCKLWNRVSSDELLWKRLFCIKWKQPLKTVTLAPGKVSWRSEYIRLCFHAPIYETEKIESHTDQVLHITFSHDGLLFSSCSKDSHVKVWNSSYPVRLKYETSMIRFNWKYTQFSQFNETDTLLLVSGVLNGLHTYGEIAVFSIKDEFLMQSRIQNRPYDIFGAWYNDSYLISGSIKWLADVVSCSILWLNSAFQEIDAENKSVLQQLCSVYNKNASSVRTIMVANCLDDVANNQPSSSSFTHNTSNNNRIINGGLEVDSDEEVESEEEGDYEVLYPGDKYLIFTTGSRAYTPHEIGIKRLKPVRFKRTIEIDLKTRLNERKEQENVNEGRQPNWLDEDAVARLFDDVECKIEMNGHIIGMALSPDHRYLYVNSRPWPTGAQVESPYEPPPIAQEIDVHVIDMTTLKEVGTILRSHKAFTPNDECFFIFLDVSNEYVASGAEDSHGYLWVRHYNALIAKLGHSDVVNSVAFNPKDEGMLVSVSDDFTIKVWRSKASIISLDILSANVQNRDERVCTEPC